MSLWRVLPISAISSLIGQSPVDYQNEPYAQGDSCNTICCRGDLSIAGFDLNGCYDSKVTNYRLGKTHNCPTANADLSLWLQVTDYNLALNQAVWAVNGPTTDANLPTFTWDGYKNRSHVGLPDKYNFDYVMMKPTL